MSDPIPIRAGVDPYHNRKTVTVTIQLRVPKEMRVSAVAQAVRERLESDKRLNLYKNRVEVFAP